MPGSVDDLHNSTGQGDLQRMIAQIPFRRLTIWGVVGFVAYQLSDFFGVREQGRCVCVCVCVCVSVCVRS